MTEKEIRHKECVTCKKLMKAKYKAKPALYIALFAVSIIAVVFAVLYLGEGNIGGTTENNDVNIEIATEGGTVNENNINSDSSTISGTIETKSDIGLYILLSVIFGTTIITVGIIYNGYKNRSQNSK